MDAALISPDQTAVCLNCDAGLTGKYCAACGQKSAGEHDLAFRHFVGHFVHEITHLDSNKIFRTLGALIARPGVLTREYLDGRKGLHINPIRVYLTVSAIYFLFAWGALVTAGGGSAEATARRPQFIELANSRGVAPEVLAAHVQEKAAKFSAVFRFASVLLSGLVLMLLFYAMGRFYVEHLIFSLHFYSFDFLAKCFVAVLFLTSDYTGESTYVVARVAYYFAAFVYLYFAMLRVYRQSAAVTLAKSAAQFAFEIALFIAINIAGYLLAVRTI